MIKNESNYEVRIFPYDNHFLTKFKTKCLKPVYLKRKINLMMIMYHPGRQGMDGTVGVERVP